MIEPDIVAELQGGLGNLMFQIASLKSFELLTKKTVEFTNFINMKRDNSHIYKDTIFSKINQDLNFETHIDRKQYDENLEIFQDLTFLLDNEKFYLKCYAQDQKFLVKSLVNKLFNFDKINVPSIYSFYTNNEICVSLHVRRGDYLTVPHILPCPTVQWYLDALNNIPKYDRLLVFSDDKQWCLETFKNVPNFIFCNINELESMKLMSQCQYHIISNSTFSWWGAYLSHSKKVILPKIWFGSSVNKSSNCYLVDGWCPL